jgi:hypothetical protein
MMETNLKEILFGWCAKIYEENILDVVILSNFWYRWRWIFLYKIDVNSYETCLILFFSWIEWYIQIKDKYKKNLIFR